MQMSQLPPSGATARDQFARYGELSRTSDGSGVGSLRPPEGQLRRTMVQAEIRNRLVFHLGGYDLMPPEVFQRRFVRELRRFEGTWHVAAGVTAMEVSEDDAHWRIAASGPDWQVATAYRLVRWDDVIAAMGRRSGWRRIVFGLFAFIDFLRGGALSGYLRTNWRYAGFFVYPYLLLAGFAGIALLLGFSIGRLSGSSLVGTAAALTAFAALLRWPGRWLFLDILLDDWIFTREYVHCEHPVLGPRLDAAASRICEAAQTGGVEEILIIGHSLGAVLAIDLLDRVLRLNPAFGQTGARVALVSVGSSILKVGLHRGAARFRAAVERVANAGGIFWGEYQALTDVMNFYKADPVAGMGVKGRSPVIRQVRVRAMIDPAAYRRIKRNLFRVHSQFVSANDLRAAYDYFMLVCGPFWAEDQVRSRHGAVSWVGSDGSLVRTATPEETVDQSIRKAAS
jgi:hypothetical protein